MTAITPYDEMVDVYGMTNNAVQYGKRVYVAIQGAGRNPYALLYDGNAWSAPVKIATTPIPADGHGFPNIVRSNDGKLHVIYGAHDSAFKYATSTNPDDISAWTDTTSKIGTQTGTYPYLFKNPADGTLFFFFREYDNYKWDYRISTDNGVTWGAATRWYTEVGVAWNDPAGKIAYIVPSQPYLIEVGGHWCIIFTWNMYINADVFNENVYYVRFDMVDKHFYAIDGTDLGTSLDTTEADTNCKIFNSAGRKCYFGQTLVGPDGTILCIYNWEYATGLYRYESMEWNGSSWVNNKVITTSNRADYTYGALFENGTKANFLVTPDNTDVERWEYDWTTKTWTQLADFATQSQCPHNPRGYFWGRCMNQLTNSKTFVFMELGGSYGIDPQSVAVGVIDVYGELKFLTDGTVLQDPRTVTVIPLLSGKLDQRHGKGPKILLANVTLEPSVEALHPSAKYLDMKTIKAVFVQGSPTFGSATMGVLVNLVAPGSVANYASFNVYRIVSGTTVAGSPQGYAMRYIAKTGTITSTMLVIGE